MPAVDPTGTWPLLAQKREKRVAVPCRTTTRFSVECAARDSNPEPADKSRKFTHADQHHQRLHVPQVPTGMHQRHHQPT